MLSNYAVGSYKWIMLERISFVTTNLLFLLCCTQIVRHP